MRPAAAALLVAFAALAAPAGARAAEPDPWVGADKALHFGVSAGLAGLGYGGAALLWDDTALRLGVGASVALTAGIAKELWDLAGHGTPSWKDLAWDALGTAVGLALAFGVDWLCFREAKPRAARRGPAPALLDSPFVFARPVPW